MESYNRITLYMAFLVIIGIVLLPCAIAQNGGRGGRGGDRGDMMGGGGRGGDREDMMGGGMMGGGGRGGDRRGIPGFGGPRREDELTESQIDRIMKEFSRLNPLKAKELETLRTTNKEKFIYELRANAFLIVAQEMREAREYREILEWCEKFVADEATGISTLKEENYDLYKKRLDSLRTKYGQLIYYQQGTSDELMRVLVRDSQLDIKERELARQYWNPAMTKEQREGMQPEIKEFLSDKYDQNIKRRTIQYQEIQKEIKRLQDMVDAQMKLVNIWNDPNFKEEELARQIKEYIEPLSYPRRGDPFSRGFFQWPGFQIPEPNSSPK